MSDICSKCGLPKELCVCESIAKESQQIKISIIKKKFGKKNTLIEGIDQKQIDLKEIGKKLGLTRERVRQLQRDALAQLNELLTS